MNTAFMLMAQYNGLAIVPIDQVCTDYFTHLTPDMFQRKVLAGQIKLPITRLESSQKSAKGIHILDLASYLDIQREAALKEHAQLNKALRSS
ncbi:pyocin activator PrtN family protein [Pseudomonas putida]|uniref:pyocin activator PrtN family protein n=1 Tax=Pseudomonas putida TaxID=303 RepID=UPI001575D20B|nr:pyocin activator PrtN family protein [Pseudomonas putida]NTY91951.1 Pyocin activator protein PrtN [Pseudomonas putida]NTY99539.1 Pyocin activator protein PrtN [Pseudomonas putida]NTZ22072.1 Pyocin activator protein PrtN [Pseudomonas putida]NTZ55627.1 Pyocin activator protein PrtN [Pseudomonas putida]NTZ65548.1 Pyocin activator protein PrtN [Pseudomonas putida]